MFRDPEAIIQDADIEAAEFEAAAADHVRSLRAMRRARAAGDLARAARLCPHGWGYPTDSPAAVNSSDPRAGTLGYRCLNCGSWLDRDPFRFPREARAVVPCELPPAE